MKTLNPTDLRAVMAILQEELPDDFEFEERWVDDRRGDKRFAFFVIRAMVRDATTKRKGPPPTVTFKVDVLGGYIHLTNIDEARIWDFDLGDPEVFGKVRTRFSMELVK